MDIFLARQPIFDRDLQVLAYELLYRSDAQALKSQFSDGSQATSSVIAQSVLVTNFDKLVSKKRAFIHFTEALILEEIPLLFDKDRIVIELDVQPKGGQGFFDALGKLKSLGYSIALNHVRPTDVKEEILAYADIIKVDLKQMDLVARKAFTDGLKGRSVKLLAEKVETREDFQESLNLGYSYFQGYFFAKPDTVKSKDIHPLSTTYLRLLEALNQKEPEVDKLAAIIEADVALSFKVLKLINSAAFYRRSKIQNIHQAIVVLGLKELRKWVMLLMLQDAGQNKPDELLKTVLIRGRLMELLAKQSQMASVATECFLTGLLSLIDVMTDQDLASVVNELALSETMNKALIHKEGPLGQLLGLVVSYEQSENDDMTYYSARLQFDVFDLPLHYFEAMEWVDCLLGE